MVIQCDKMTRMEHEDILERLRGIMRSNKLSQEVMANKIGVSQKTISYWLTGKARPTAKKSIKIAEICDRHEKGNKKSKGNEKGIKIQKGNEKGNDDLTDRVLKGILLEAQAGKELDEEDKQNTERYRQYYNAKVIALTLEDKNRSRLILFPSVSGMDDEWYKMGGQSALFYKYVVGPRLKKKPIIRKDTDIRHRFKHGIVTVHWGKKFISDVATIGLKAKRIDYGIIIVEMEREYTANEIMEMHKIERESADKVKKMIMPVNNYPDMYALMRQLVQILLPKIKKMDSVYREIFGTAMLDALMKLIKTYFRMANGRMNTEVAREEMLGRVDDMTGLLAIMDEGQLLDLVTRTRVGETLVEIKMAVLRRLK